MDSDILSKLILNGISAFTTLSILIYAISKRRKYELVYIFIFNLITTFLFAIGKIFELLSNNLTTQWISLQISYISVNFAGTTWLIFCLKYVNHRFIQKRINIFFLLIPCILLHILFITNNYHHLYYRILEYRVFKMGIGFGIAILLTIINQIISCFLLSNYMKGKNKHTKTQARILIIGPLISLLFIIIAAINMYFLNDFIPLRHLVGPSNTIMMVLVAIAIFKYQFLNIMPIAFRTIVNNMKESVIVVDNTNRIVDYNSSFKYNFSEVKINLYDDIDTLIDMFNKIILNNEEWKRIITELKNEHNISGQLIFQINGERHFIVNIQPIIDEKQKILGRVISLSDISGYKNLIEELSRIKFLRDTHDIVGRTFTALIRILETSVHNYEKNPSETQTNLNNAFNIAQQGMKEFRESLYNMVSQKDEIESFIKKLTGLFSIYESSGMRINFSFEPNDNYTNSIYYDLIYNVCQEALTNSLRHGKASETYVFLEFTDFMIKLFVIDNGVGAKTIKKGFGLSIMEQRIREFNGTIFFGSDGLSGFNTRVEIPYVRGSIK
jgi:signal transduction histidine kinase